MRSLAEFRKLSLLLQEAAWLPAASRSLSGQSYPALMSASKGASDAGTVGGSQERTTPEPSKPKGREMGAATPEDPTMYATQPKEGPNAQDQKSKPKKKKPYSDEKVGEPLKSTRERHYVDADKEEMKAPQDHGKEEDVQVADTDKSTIKDPATQAGA